MTTKTYFGRLRFDTAKGDTELWVNGEHIFDNIDTSLFPDVPLETDLIIELGGLKLVDWSTDPTLPAATRATTRKDIALGVILPYGQEPKDSDWRSANQAAKKLQDEYRRVSAGKWEVNCTPYVLNNEQDGGFGLREFAFDGVFKEHARQVNPDNRHNYWHGVGGYSPAYCGLAWLGGNEAWTFKGCPLGTKPHEQGHNFGLGHAGTLAGGEYGEGNTWMGTGWRRDDFNTPHLMVLNLIDEDHIEDLAQGQSGMFYLTQGTTSMLAMTRGEQKIVRVNPSNGVIKKLSVSYHDGNVDIHKPKTDNSRSFTYTTRLATLEPEEQWTGHGIIINYVERKGDVAAVQILTQDSPDVPAEPSFPVRRVPVEGAYDPLKAGGVWGNSEWSVQGVHIHPLPDRNQVLVFWLTWDKEGDQHWYFMTADIDDSNVVSGTLYRGIRSNSSRQVVEAGTAQLYFTNDTQGIFYATTRDQGKFATPLSRISRTTEDNRNGYWGLGDTSLEGLSVGVTGNTLVAYWMSYQKPENQYVRITPPGQQWYLIQGPADGEQTVYEIEGGVVGVKADYQMTPVGSARINDNQAELLGKEYQLISLA